MEDKFNLWFSQVDGKPIEMEDPTNLDQCFDLAFSWCDFLNIPRDSIRHLRAYEIFTSPNPDTTEYWEIIANTPTGVPQVGDLVIWGTQVGVSGHVAVFKEGDTTSFRSEDQNWAGLQKAHLTNHSYNGVLGWLHPKSAIIAQPTAQSLPQYFEGLLQENGLDLNNESQIREFFQEAKDYPALVVDKVNAEKANAQQAILIAQLRKDLLDCQQKPATGLNPVANIKFGIILNGHIYGQ